MITYQGFCNFGVYVLARVCSQAETDTDEVYAQVTLMPEPNVSLQCANEELLVISFYVVLRL